MTVLIAAGGTGGHVYPALAVADVLAVRGTGIHWIGSDREIERKVVAPKYSLNAISMRGFSGGLIDKLTLPWVIVKSMIECTSIIKKVKPEALFSTGGYVSLPVGIVARIKRIPIILHESNAEAGLSNRLLAKISTVILTSYDGVLSSEKTIVVGTPVRAELDAKKPILVLSNTLGVLGGSLGAKVLNENVPRALSRMRHDERPTVVHQTGRGKFISTKVHYDRALVEAEVVEYIDDMADFYQKVGLLICRAGALTVTELTHAGVPAILIPYPYAAGDHQTANAKRLVEKGAARLIPQSEATPERLAAEIKELMTDKVQREEMALKMRSLRQRGVAQHVADIIQSTYRNNHRIHENKEATNA